MDAVRYFGIITAILAIVVFWFILIYPIMENEFYLVSSFICNYREKHKKKLVVKDLIKLNNKVKRDNKITDDSIYDMVCDIMKKYPDYYYLENKNKNEIKEFFSFISYVFGLTKIYNFDEKVKRGIIRCIITYSFLFGEDFDFENSNIHVQFNEFKMLKIFKCGLGDAARFKVCDTKTNQEYLIDENAFVDLLNDSNLTIDKVCLSEAY